MVRERQPADRPCAGRRGVATSGRQNMSAVEKVERQASSGEAEAGPKASGGADGNAALSLAGSMPETTFLVDDTRANVDAARAAGWAACHWTGEQRLLELLETARAG